MSGLGEQIAVLDGLTIAPGDGNYGGGASYPDAGRWPLLPSSAGLNGSLGAHNDLMGAAQQVYRREGLPDLPNVAPKKRVFASYSGGANRSGGSTYPDSGQFPTWAQAGAGLAANDLMGLAAASYPRDLPNVAPRKKVFASPAGGANYTGGSNYPDSGQFPTWAQAGAGLAGLGRCGCDLRGLGTLPNVGPDKRVFASMSGGANYSGGSSYPDGGRTPLLSSTVGLASFGATMPPQTREQIMAMIQLRSQQLVQLTAIIPKLEVGSPQRAQAQRLYVQTQLSLCVLRNQVGLPTLPECQKIIAMINAGNQLRAQANKLLKKKWSL